MLSFSRRTTFTSFSKFPRIPLNNSSIVFFSEAKSLLDPDFPECWYIRIDRFYRSLPSCEKRARLVSFLAAEGRRDKNCRIYELLFHALIYLIISLLIWDSSLVLMWFWMENFISLWKGLWTGFFSTSWNSSSWFYSSSSPWLCLSPSPSYATLVLFFGTRRSRKVRRTQYLFSLSRSNPLSLADKSLVSFPRVVIARRLEFSLNLCNSTNSFFIICLPLSGSPALSRLPLPFLSLPPPPSPYSHSLLSCNQLVEINFVRRSAAPSSSFAEPVAESSR